MIDFIQKDPWCIIEEGFEAHRNEQCEALFSLGNGKMGCRANFEETYSGPTLQGNYIAGVYYPDKTRVGWWKNGYPEYFAKVLNASHWAGLKITINGTKLDLNTLEVSDFKRTLNMHEGVLYRTFKAKINEGQHVQVRVVKFLSLVNDEIGALSYTITPLDFDAEIAVESFVDFDIKNADANYDEKFWVELDKRSSRDRSYVTAETKKTAFHVCTGIHTVYAIDGQALTPDEVWEHKEKYAANTQKASVAKGSKFEIFKLGTNTSSENYPHGQLYDWASENLSKASKKGFDQLLAEHKAAWSAKWKESDIVIEGDVAAQQAIRFNIFHLNQTYTGQDERLNIGPKGFTGEKYGGSTYWDTEAYCLPFYLGTADEKVAKQLLVYRYKQLGKAIENAEKLGFTNGAALFPMVTMNGEECHNEWEITFEEIHRNGAISLAVQKYINYTGDLVYLARYGLELLIAISRFWSQRIHFSAKKEKFVMLGVTGPNEYENNIDNNFYTNYIATWCLRFTHESALWLKENHPDQLERIAEKTNFNWEETKRWEAIWNNMHFPFDEDLNVYLQQENFLDKEIIPAAELPAAQRPINQHWSWDRILRSCYIKQADTLQGFYFFEDDFSQEEHERHFDFYEPITVHESSLSPCIHSILAAKLNRVDKAYEMYMRTARLDLDDYNNEVHEGLHITSMAGTWMAFVEGFGGMRVKEGRLHFNPTLPEQWKAYSFNVQFRKHIVTIETNNKHTVVSNNSSSELELVVHGETLLIAANNSKTLAHG